MIDLTAAVISDEDLRKLEVKMAGTGETERSIHPPRGVREILTEPIRITEFIRDLDGSIIYSQGRIHGPCRGPWLFPIPGFIKARLNTCYAQR